MITYGHFLSLFMYSHSRPQSLLTGMNQFLESLEITFRRDPTNYRPRINKLYSVKDKEQKLSKNYFFMEEQLQHD
jgi:ATP-binding cassette subfamily E protein 1